jgi:hypothetical protein
MKQAREIKTIISILLLFGICLIGFTQSTSETKEIGYIIFTPDSVVFENEFEAKELLDQYTKSINEISSKERQIHINGYTAIFNNEIDPHELSTDRANIILNELLLRGISSERFDIIKGNGETNNWGNNNISENRKPNRRVTISIDEFKELGNGHGPDDNNGQDKPTAKINWKKVAIIVGIIVVVAVIVLLIIFVIGPMLSGGTGAIPMGGGGGSGKAPRIKTPKIPKVKPASTKTPLQQGIEKMYRGGRYGDLISPEGIERHHMPPWNSFPSELAGKMSYNEVPCIQMDKADHARTLGYSGRKGLDELYELMKKGKYWQVVKKCIKDVKTNFPGKYDDAIKQFLIAAKEYQKIYLQNLRGLKL